MEHKNRKPRLGACVLSAGFSSRMGAFKPLLQLGDTTVIERVLNTLKTAGIEEIAVITGYNREELIPIITKMGVREIFNRDFENGMFTSIRAGAQGMPVELDGFFIIPVDCPLFTEEVLQRLTEEFDPDKFSVPCYRGKKGHPLLVPEKYRREIIEHDGQRGLKAITDRHFESMKRIPVDHEGVVMDMDTPDAYEKIRKYLDAGCKSENIAELANGRRFILIRHGQIRRHKEKIFLGQTDVPMSDIGKLQAQKAGEILSALKPETDKIYTSDLLRAVQTAEIVMQKASISNLAEVPGLREINLGLWDGKFISEIKSRFPEEYNRRGKNIMTYKSGNGSENFFDLQYRVCKTLIDIMKTDKNRDIIITAHSGVLRVVCNNLYGKDVSDSWEKIDNGEVRIIEK